MPSPQNFRLTRGKLNRLAHSGLDSFTYRERTIRTLRPVLDFSAAWWWTIDPASMLFTSGVFEPLPSDHAICGGLHRNEFGNTDYNKFRVLAARRAGQVGTLSEATGGQLERSERYQHMLAPLGYEHELRLALSDHAALWGGIALLREPGSPDFTAAEARRIASLGSILTDGLRIGVAFGAASVDCTPDGPGMLIIDDDLNIVTATSNAEGWLDEIADGSPGLPDAVRSVVGCVKELHRSETPEDLIPRARVRGVSGRWLAIYASRAHQSSSGSVHTAVIVQEAKPSEVAPVIISAYGLSRHEAQVTRLVLQGLSTKQIAAETHKSPYTVQDHLKVIFAKVGVRSRRDLTVA